MSFHSDLFELSHAAFQAQYRAPISEVEFCRWKAAADPSKIGRVIKYIDVSIASQTLALSGTAVITKVLFQITSGAGNVAGLVAGGAVLQGENQTLVIENMHETASSVQYVKSGTPTGQILVFGYYPPA